MRITPVLTYSGYQKNYLFYLYEAVTLYSCFFQNIPICDNLFKWSYNPFIALTIKVWANSLSLATTNEITICFLFLQVLRCFSSLCLLTLKVFWFFKSKGYPIRKSTGYVICANNRSLSQLITSFIAFESLDIPHMLLITLLYYITQFVKELVPVK
jgi:hypothetical protein